MKRLKNIETNQNSNNNDKSKLSNTRNESSFYFTPSNSTRSESSKKTLISDDELERSISFPDVANIKGINILESKNGTQTSFQYSKSNTKEFFRSYRNIFDSDLEEFFKDIASEEEKYIDYKLLLKQILLLSRKTFSFLQKYGDLYNFWTNFLNNMINLDEIKSQQIKFLKDLMNRFEVYKIIKNPKNQLNYKAKNLYLTLLGNSNKTVNDIFLKKPTDKHNKEIYSQAKILFNLRKKIFKKLFNKGIIKNNSDQSDIEEYKESITERTKLRRQGLEIIKEK